jgi:hypothetical protein
MWQYLVIWSIQLGPEKISLKCRNLELGFHCSYKAVYQHHPYTCLYNYSYLHIYCLEPIKLLYLFMSTTHCYLLKRNLKTINYHIFTPNIWQSIFGWLHISNLCPHVLPAPDFHIIKLNRWVLGFPKQHKEVLILYQLIQYQQRDLQDACGQTLDHSHLQWKGEAYNMEGVRIITNRLEINSQNTKTGD